MGATPPPKYFYFCPFRLVLSHWLAEGVLLIYSRQQRCPKNFRWRLSSSCEFENLFITIIIIIIVTIIVIIIIDITWEEGANAPSLPKYFYFRPFRLLSHWSEQCALLIYSRQQRCPKNFRWQVSSSCEFENLFIIIIIIILSSSSSSSSSS